MADQVVFSAERLSEITDCPICTETYSDPRSLPCVHTFCFKCISQWTEQSSSRQNCPCPICRKVFILPEKGVADLPKNFFVTNLLEMKEKPNGAVSLKRKTPDYERELNEGSSKKGCFRGAEAERRSLEQPNPVGSNLVGLYVGNLHPTIFDSDLRSLFMKFGSIRSAYVIKAKHVSKCYGFVVFHTAQSAAQAMREMNGVVVKSCAICVNYSDRQPSAEEVNGVVDQGPQYDASEQYSSTSSRHGSSSSRYGSNDGSWNDDQLSESMSDVSDENAHTEESPVSLYVGHLHPSVDDWGLRCMFVRFGEIRSATVMTRANGQSKHYGFVVFNSAQSAAHAWREMDGYSVKSWNMRVEFADSPGWRVSDYEATTSYDDDDDDEEESVYGDSGDDDDYTP